MNRNLNSEEKKKVKAGLKNRQLRLSKTSRNLEYNQSLLAKQEYTRSFSDKWRDYLKQVKDEQDKEVIDKIKEEINMEKEIISNLQKQIKEGVEVKIPLGVE